MVPKCIGCWQQSGMHSWIWYDSFCCDRVLMPVMCKVGKYCTECYYRHPLCWWLISASPRRWGWWWTRQPHLLNRVNALRRCWVTRGALGIHAWLAISAYCTLLYSVHAKAFLCMCVIWLNRTFCNENVLTSFNNNSLHPSIGVGVAMSYQPFSHSVPSCFT